MIEELTFVLLNENKARQKKARAAAVATYGKAEGKRRWKVAKKKAKECLVEGGSSDDYCNYLRAEAMDGLRMKVLAALTTLREAREDFDELYSGSATHIAYEDTQYGADLAQYLKTAAAALRAARDLHARIILSDRVTAASEELDQCPYLDGQCRHGQPWPCQVTRASWALHGQDAVEQIRAANGGAS